MTFTAGDALPPNADDCKARDAPKEVPLGDEAKGGTLGKERNAAGAAFGGNPKGRGKFGRIAALLVACLE